MSRSLSPSFFRELSFPNSTSFQSTSLQDQPKKISDPKRKKSKAWDLESTDTEALISESIYGSQPVNMGGTFHQSLYRDKTIQQLHDSSVKKIGKLVKAMSSIPGRGLKCCKKINHISKYIKLIYILKYIIIL